MQIFFEIGDIVVSKAGRDKNKYFAVIQIINQDFVLISDGQLRDLDRPKLKRSKHLRKVGYSNKIAEQTAQAMIDNISIVTEIESIIEK